MKRLFVVIMALAVCSLSWAATAKEDAIERLSKAGDVLKEVMGTPDKGIPQEVLDLEVQRQPFSIGILIDTSSSMKPAFGMTTRDGILIWIVRPTLRGFDKLAAHRDRIANLRLFLEELVEVGFPFLRRTLGSFGNELV